MTGESSGAHRPGQQSSESWDVSRFLKNGGQLFYGSTDPEIALEWIDTARGVLAHMGCPAEIWVRVATGAMQRMGKIWWESAHTAFLGSRPLEQISWDEFKEVFYSQYFSATVRAKKKMEFLSLAQEETMSVAEYQARFLTLERFALGSCSSERDRAAQFVSGLRISLRSVVATFSCVTMAEAVMRALECEHAHDSYHQARSGGRQGQRRGGQDHQGPQQQRRRTEDGVTAYAAEGQQLQRFPPQTQSFQPQGQQTMEYQERPTCPHCQGRHWGVCRRITRACYACGELGHRAAVCPNRPQQPQYQQPQYQQPQYQQAQYQQRPQQQQRRGLPAPPQRPLLPAPLPHPQGQQLRGDRQPRAQHGQFGQQGQRAQQRQAGLAAVDAAQLPGEDVRQIGNPLYEQMQAARPEHQGGVDHNLEQ